MLLPDKERVERWKAGRSREKAKRSVYSERSIDSCDDFRQLLPTAPRGTDQAPPHDLLFVLRKSGFCFINKVVPWTLRSPTHASGYRVDEVWKPSCPSTCAHVLLGGTWLLCIVLEPDELNDSQLSSGNGARGVGTPNLKGLVTGLSAPTFEQFEQFIFILIY